MEQIKHGFDFEYFDTYICENVIGHTTLFIEYNNENEKSDENISNEIKKMTEKLFSEYISKLQDKGIEDIQARNITIRDYIKEGIENNLNVSIESFQIPGLGIKEEYQEEYKQKRKEIDEKKANNEKIETCESQNIEMKEEISNNSSTEVLNNNSNNQNNIVFLVGGIILVVVVIIAICAIIKNKKR